MKSELGFLLFNIISYPTNNYFVPLHYFTQQIFLNSLQECAHYCVRQWPYKDE